jgi:hypothetical protein
MEPGAIQNVLKIENSNYLSCSFACKTSASSEISNHSNIKKEYEKSVPNYVNLFLDSKNEAFFFDPIFETSHNIILFQASSANNESDVTNNKFTFENLNNSNILDLSYVYNKNNISNNDDNSSTKSFQSDDIYNDELLSSGFCSMIDESTNN